MPAEVMALLLLKFLNMPELESTMPIRPVDLPAAPSSIWPLTVVLILAGCAASVPIHSMSAAGHAAAADREEASAADHAGKSTAGIEHCGVPLVWGLENVCWASRVNPTAAHLREAAQHRELAAAHRAASTALRDAEARACSGISEEDRDVSPFAHREDIEGVEPLSMPLSAKSGGFRAQGAAVRFRAVPGMTPEWLQRLVDCHLARNASMGHAMPEMSGCPLAVQGVTATVTSTGRGFAIQIRSDGAATALEIRRRAEALLPRQ